jgi:hypothetical protein
VILSCFFNFFMEEIRKGQQKGVALASAELMDDFV